jgi:hypothetical protein
MRRIGALCLLVLFILAPGSESRAAASDRPALEIICQSDELQETIRQMAGRITPRLNEFMGTAPERIKILVASSKAEFQGMAQRLNGPDWAAGIAIPARQLILLRSPSQLIDPGGFERLLAHELLHLYFHTALGSKHAPLWLEEGLAMHLSGDSSLGRIWAMSQAVLMDSLIPFERLQNSFPADGKKAQTAYAQSYYFVGFLLERFGPEITAQMLRGLAQGKDLSGVLHQITGMGLVALEKAFVESVGSRFSWIMVIFSGSVLWGVAALIAAVGLVLRRRAQLRERSRAPDPDPMVGVLGPTRKWPPPKRSAEVLNEAGLGTKSPPPPNR